MCFQSLATEIIFYKDKTGAFKDLPFSKVTQVGNLLFLSGELGVDPKTGHLVTGGIEAETKQLMENISATLNKHHSSLDKVAKCTVFLADIKEWGQFNTIYRRYFKNNFPARSALAGSGLGLNARVEVECIAVVK
ncbi:MAG: Rid family detoxifying hydrolase [Enterobacterales bacterium]|nr:Rid family detoxifying hydrolase [Enterobacterales bacterium]